MLNKTQTKTWYSIREFKEDLAWSAPDDQKWLCRDGFPFLGFVSFTDSIELVRCFFSEMNIISDRRKRLKYINARAPKHGLVEIGIPGHTVPLMGAMMACRSEIVSIMLENGADPYESGIGRNDAFMFASIFGRTDNVKFWLDI